MLSRHLEVLATIERVHAATPHLPLRLRDGGGPRRLYRGERSQIPARGLGRVPRAQLVLHRPQVHVGVRQPLERSRNVLHIQGNRAHDAFVGASGQRCNERSIHSFPALVRTASQPGCRRSSMQTVFLDTSRSGS